jgi:phosphoribosyl-AMP cyclohydrolase
MIQKLDNRLLRALGTNESSIRRLSLDMKVPYATLWRRIKALEKSRALTARTRGRSKIYSINREPKKFSMSEAEKLSRALDYKGGLIAAVAKDWLTKEILMLAYMNKEAVRETLTSGYATYFSRSRKKLWRKGETSGNLQIVKGILLDCDNDSLILDVEQVGVACHTGNRSCFYRKLEELTH